MLTKKIHSQLTYVLGEDAAHEDADRGARPGDATEDPERLVPLGALRAKVTSVIEKTDGERIAPAAPWSRRAMMSISEDVDNRQERGHEEEREPRP